MSRRIVRFCRRFKSKLARKLALSMVIRLDDKARTAYRELYHAYYGVKIGKHTYGYQKNSIVPGTTIGSFCSIAENVKIGLMNHPTYMVSSHPFLYYKNRGFCSENQALQGVDNHAVVIEDDVWIGTNAVVMPAITIHKGAVVAAGAIVTKDIPPYEIWGGVPARFIKKRFSDDIIHKLNGIDWCQWDDTDIKDRIQDFYDPIEFVHKYRNEDG